MKQKSLFLAIIFIFAVSCNQPDSSPHLKDPIYLDIEKAIGEIDQELESKQEELMDVEAALPGLEVGSQAKVKAQRKYFSLKKEVRMLQQNKLHAELRLKTRYIQGRTESLEAFRQGKEWDPSRAFESYKRNRMLVNTPKIWQPKVKKRGLAEANKEPESKEGREN